MSYKLEQPYTEEERIEFIVNYNHNQGLVIEETEKALYALEANEFMYNDEPTVDPNYYVKLAKNREELFKKDFFYIPEIKNAGFDGGWYRKQPKGYSSAIESINTANIYVQNLGILPENTLTFYNAPDFMDETQCNEEWLIAHQFKNKEMQVEQFINFTLGFITSWNTTQH